MYRLSYACICDNVYVSCPAQTLTVDLHTLNSDVISGQMLQPKTKAKILDSRTRLSPEVQDHGQDKQQCYQAEVKTEAKIKKFL